MKLTSETAVDTPHAAAVSAVGAPSRWAFVGAYTFTLLLYVRPNELLPSVFGTLPLAKTAALATVVFFVVSRVSAGSLTIWPTELKLLLAMVFIAVVTIPFSVAPGDGVGVLSDNLGKAVIMCVVIMNVAGTPGRLRALLRLVVVCGAALAVFAVRDFEAGFFPTLNAGQGVRIAGIVNGMFGNPNDLATSVSLLVPFAVGLATTRRGLPRTAFMACAALLMLAVVVSFSRGGFLSLIAMGCFMLWKLRRRHRGAIFAVGVLVIVGALLIAPSGYSNRLSTIVDIQTDKTGSAQERYELMKRAAQVAATRPLIGVGVGNYHIYSIQEYVAHNSYLEVAAELGWLGLLAYLGLIVAPLRSLRRIERATDAPVEGASPETTRVRDEVHVMSMMLQASFISYAVCSFFASIEYQWHIYYLVGYAVALKTIHATYAEAPVEEDRDVAAADEPVRGVLWGRRPTVGVN